MSKLSAGKRYPDRKPNLWDGLVFGIVLVLAVCAALVIWPEADAGDHLTAVIAVDGEEQERIDLTRLDGEEEQSLTANGYTLSIILYPDGAEVRSSDCPTQDCVHTGKITRVGQSIVCLPARVTVQLTGAAEPDGVDTIVR